MELDDQSIRPLPYSGPIQMDLLVFNQPPQLEARSGSREVTDTFTQDWPKTTNSSMVPKTPDLIPGIHCASRDPTIGCLAHLQDTLSL